MTTPQDIDAADRLIVKVNQLHSGPRVAQQLLALTREDDFDLQEVVDCLNHDPALSARILRLVNSSRYGLSHSITSVRHAASYLGRRSLRLTVLTFALVETLARGAKGRMFGNYWRRTLTMATVAANLARRRSEIAEDDAYTSGLLADVGVLVFAQFEGDRYVPLHESTAHGPELLAVERDRFGFDHALLGARLLEYWDVPDSIVEAVASHHRQHDDTVSLQLAVRASDLMADALWTPKSQQVRVAKELLERQFGIDLDGFIELAVSIQGEIEESAELFGIPVDSSVACQQLLDEARRLFADASLQAARELDTLETVIDDLTA